MGSCWGRRGDLPPRQPPWGLQGSGESRVMARVGPRSWAGRWNCVPLDMLWVRRSQCWDGWKWPLLGGSSGHGGCRYHRSLAQILFGSYVLFTHAAIQSKLQLVGSWPNIGRGSAPPEGKVGPLWLPPVEADHAEAQPGGCRRPWGEQSQPPSLMAVELPMGPISLSGAHWCHRKKQPWPRPWCTSWQDLAPGEGAVSPNR